MREPQPVRATPLLKTTRNPMTTPIIFGQQSGFNHNIYAARPFHVLEGIRAL
jgi:hypothetical protein